MTQEVIQQIAKLLSSSRSLLVCLPVAAGPDEVAASLALRTAIEQSSDKHLDLVSDDFSPAEQLGFLGDLDNLLPKLPALQKFTISLDIKDAPIDSFSYAVHNKHLEIYIRPKHGTYSAQDVSTESSHYRYDAIITLGVASLQSLGQVFRQTPDFFYAMPIINIDHQSNNENFGEINALELTASSVCEQVLQLIKALWPKQTLDKDSATQLLAGILYKTNGLKSPRLTPQLLDTVSQLIELGADIVEINAHLFHHKSLSILRLWGRALARLKEDTDLGLVWSLIPYDDFIKTNTNEKDLPNIIQELIDTYHQAKQVLLLWQNDEQTVSGLLKVSQQQNALQLLQSLKPRGRADMAHFKLNIKNLLEAEKLILDTLRT